MKRCLELHSDCHRGQKHRGFCGKFGKRDHGRHDHHHDRNFAGHSRGHHSFPKDWECNRSPDRRSEERHYHGGHHHLKHHHGMHHHGMHHHRMHMHRMHHHKMHHHKMHWHKMHHHGMHHHSMHCHGHKMHPYGGHHESDNGFHEFRDCFEGPHPHNNRRSPSHHKECGGRVKHFRGRKSCETSKSV